MTDVIIVGGGNAAFAAAVAASQQGASVLVLERAPLEEAGGNTRFTAGAIRFAYEGAEDLRKLMPDLTDEECARSDFGWRACLGAVAFYNYWVAEQLTASEAGAPALVERLWAVNKLGLAAVAALYVGGQLALVLPQVWGRRRRPGH